jgi:hypothetical protein
MCSVLPNARVITSEPFFDKLFFEGKVDIKTAYRNFNERAADRESASKLAEEIIAIYREIIVAYTESDRKKINKVKSFFSSKKINDLSRKNVSFYVDAGSKEPIKSAVIRIIHNI